MKKEALIWLGELAVIHATGKETGGKYCLIELYATSEGSPPWHVHHNEDEGFYIIEGELTISVGDKTYKAKKGDFLLAPKNIPHTYQVDSPGFARVLLMCSPAGFEDAVREMSMLAESLVPPNLEGVEIDFDRIVGIAKKYGVEFVDPPIA